MALYTDVDCFPIVFETEEELLKWFLTLLKIQLAGQVAEGEELKQRYGIYFSIENLYFESVEIMR